MAKNDQLDLIRKRFASAEAGMSDNRKEALTDIKFKHGEQWPSEVAKRGQDKVQLTINKTQAFVKQVVNEQRQARPSIRVRPVDGESDPQIAEVIEGLIRNIESQSRAEAVYDWGFECAVDGGYGYWRINTEYADEDSFDQDIRIRRIRNRFDVLFDPKCEDTMKEDAQYCFVHKRLEKKEILKKYRDASLEGFSDANWEGWIDDESARVVEYYYKKKQQKVLALYDDGTVITVPEDIGGEKIDPEEWAAAYANQKGLGLVKTRVSDYHAIKWCIATAGQVLKEGDWAGRYIPIIPVIGDEIDIEGKVYYAGLIRWLRDPARMYNYWLTKATESIALSPRQKMLVTPEMIAGYEKFWDRANVDPRVYLPYNRDPSGATPREVQPPQLPTGFANMVALATDQMKEVSGIYDASLGARSNETSGVAIQQRQQQGDTANFHFIDNLNRSIAYTGKVLVDLIPRIYDAQRTIRILGEDGSVQNVQLQSPVVDEDGMERRREDGKPLLYDLSVGRYDVVCESGPGFSTKRQESFDYMLQLVQANPALMQVFGDLMFKNSDLPNSDEIAQRLAQMMQGPPPGGPTELPPGGAIPMPGNGQ